MSAPSGEKRIIKDIRDIVPAGTKKYVCSINKYHHVDGWMKKITYYTIITVSLGAAIPERGSIDRRYNEFSTLCTQLTSKYGGDTIPQFLTPRNRFLENHLSEEFLQARCLLLADWLNKVINLNTKLKDDELIHDFLDLKRSTVYDESIGASTTATFGGSDNGISSIFSVTQGEKVKLSQKDYDYLPTNGEVMTVHKITDDDL